MRSSAVRSFGSCSHNGPVAGSKVTSKAGGSRTILRRGADHVVEAATAVNDRAVGGVAVLNYDFETEDIQTGNIARQQHPEDKQALAIVLQRQVDLTDAGEVRLVETNRNRKGGSANVTTGVSGRNRYFVLADVLTGED